MGKDEDKVRRMREKMRKITDKVRMRKKMRKIKYKLRWMGKR